MSDMQDDGQRIALLASMMVVSGLVLSLVLAVGLRLAFAPAPDAVPLDAAASQVDLIDAPLGGELTGTVYFGVDTATLDRDATAELASVARVLLASPGKSVVLAGFHGAELDAGSATRLALQRARMVQTELIKAGIDAARLRLHQPLSTAAGADTTLARRVEVRVID
jgi:outer membrane protein OmpA-like peptidoglycan-associated protein